MKCQAEQQQGSGNAPAEQDLERKIMLLRMHGGVDKTGVRSVNDVGWKLSPPDFPRMLDNYATSILPALRLAP
jgi:hypothetical protein